jgi:hypothetical protein
MTYVSLDLRVPVVKVRSDTGYIIELLEEDDGEEEAENA